MVRFLEVTCIFMPLTLIALLVIGMIIKLVMVIINAI